MQESINILVVDDDKGTRESLAEILEIQGYKTDSAENGQKAMKLIGEKN